MAVKDRTDDEKLAIAPIKVQLGGKEYNIPVRRILAARKWREEFIEAVSSMGTSMLNNVTSVTSFVGGFAFAFLRFPEKIADLVFSYDPSLPRDVIEGEGPDAASEEELALAFGAIMKVAFPFLSELSMVNQVLRTAEIQSPSARPTN